MALSRPWIAVATIVVAVGASALVARSVLVPHHADPRPGFRAGERAGAACEGSVRCVAERAAEKHDDLGEAFHDGAAHRLDWGTLAPEDQVAAVDLEIARPYRAIMLTGLVIHVCRENEADPERVMPFVEGLSELTDIERQNGVRIGLQQALGGDMPAALAAARRFPDAYQPALVEELGWRAGARSRWLARPARTVERVLTSLEEVPTEHRPSFVHGACRAAGVAGRAFDTHPPLLEHLPAELQAPCLQATAWNLVEAGVERDRAVASLRDLPRESWREQALGAFETFSAPGRPHGEHGIWEILGTTELGGRALDGDVGEGLVPGGDRPL